MEFSRSAIDLMKIRRSWRSYLDSLTDSAQLYLLRDMLAGEHRGPFGGGVRFVLLDGLHLPPEQLRRMGTYGFIQGTKTFIAGIIREQNRCREDFGYVFERLILRITDMGLGTCWMAGTFNKSGFAANIGLRDGDIMPAITPIGPIADHHTPREMLMRTVTGSNGRKPWTGLFYHISPATPLAPERAGSYCVPLEMVRLAPSSRNGQPWRIIKDYGADIYHFYYHLPPMQRLVRQALGGDDDERLDLGIAMLHFELAAREKGLAGHWEDRARDLTTAPKNMVYCVSWIG